MTPSEKRNPNPNVRRRTTFRSDLHFPAIVAPIVTGSFSGRRARKHRMWRQFDLGCAGRGARFAKGRGGTGLSYPQGIALDSSGKIYVADEGAVSVFVYPAGSNGNAAPSSATISTTMTTGLAPIREKPSPRPQIRGVVVRSQE